MNNPPDPPGLSAPWATVTLVFTLVGPLVGYILAGLQSRLSQDAVTSMVEYLVGWQATLLLVPLAYFLGGVAAFSAAQFHMLGMRYFRHWTDRPGTAPLIGALAGFAGLFVSYVAWHSGAEGFLGSLETKWVGVPAGAVCALLLRKRGWPASSTLGGATAG